MTSSEGPNDQAPLTEREIKWRRKLRRLRFNAEPLEDQVAKYRRATIVLTIVPSFIGLFILAIFTAFRRPDIGLASILILFVPMVGWAWFDYWLLSKRFAKYQEELKQSL